MLGVNVFAADDGRGGAAAVHVAAAVASSTCGAARRASCRRRSTTSKASGLRRRRRWPSMRSRYASSARRRHRWRGLERLRRSDDGRRAHGHRHDLSITPRACVRLNLSAAYFAAWRPNALRSRRDAILRRRADWRHHVRLHVALDVHRRQPAVLGDRVGVSNS